MATSFQGFRSLIENGPDAISLIDGRGEILYGSASTTRLFGYQPEELLGRNCLELIHPEDRDRTSQVLSAVLAEPPHSRQWDARVRHKDGNYRWVESTAWNLLRELEVQAIVLQQKDIQTRRDAELERQRHAADLVRSNLRLEEFAHTAAHDLREPLRAVSIYTQLLIQGTEMNPEAQVMANFILDGTARMCTLIDDLLSFSMTGTLAPPCRVDLQHAMNQAIQNLAPDINLSGAILTSGPLPVVRSSEIQLVRLFQNLISNAVKYRREAPVEIHVTAERQGAQWVVRIKDTGTGIAAENQVRVFLPFIRLVTRDVPGTGLGLAVCKRIVEGFGGTIWVESELGVGSTFCFLIDAELDGQARTISQDAVQ